ncbi:telomerase-binding protein EST1A [Nematostella vectensis]|uniref:telomerase-binding protein EST1A n=1 Tax=Nematostella vectensis TaxID=45351 RepID=UPI0013903C8D|nr:telomerase-binding protein EST1A [Nematostella vectensis]
MAARGSTTAKKSATKKVRITYQELVDIAEQLTRDDKATHSRKKSKKKSVEHEKNAEKTQAENSNVADVDLRRLERMKKEQVKNEKTAENTEENTEKRAKKKREMKDKKKRSSEEQKTAVLDNYKSVNKRRETKDSFSSSDGSSTHCIGDIVSSNSRIEDNPCNEGIDNNGKISSGKSKLKRISKEDGKHSQMSHRHKENNGKSEVDTDSHKEDINRDRDRQHRRSKAEKKPQDKNEQGNTSRLCEIQGAHMDEVEESAPVRHGGILRQDSQKHKEVHVHFKESMHGYDGSNELRGIIRIPDGVDITAQETVDIDSMTTGVSELDIDEGQNPQYRLYHSDKDSSIRASNELRAAKEQCISRESTNESQVRREATAEGDLNHHDKAEKRIKAINRQRAQQLLHLTNQAEASLNNLLSKDITSRESFIKARTLSKEIQESAKGVMMLDLSFASKNDMDHVLWKSAFYNVIETFRKTSKLFLGYSHEKHVMSPEEIHQELWDFLVQAHVFYVELMELLQSTHGFDINSVISHPKSSEMLARNAKLALLSCHHILIFLGDIERYKEQMQSSKTINWGAVRVWYLKASKLAPKNGKPYNQLAVIAVYANRKLDAIYYYVRSLAVSSPILTAREKLTTIFYEIQRKAEQLNEDQRQERLRQKRLREQTEEARLGRGRGRGRGVRAMTGERNTNARHEIWVLTHHGVCKRYMVTDEGQVLSVNAAGQQITDDETAENQPEPARESPKVSLQEINKKFMLHYLCAHGLLYTRISMDHLPSLKCELMGELHTLLGYPLCSSVSRATLLQMAAINMFAIDHTTPHDEEETYIRLGTPQDQALNLAFDMVLSLLTACTALLNNQNEPDSYHANDSDFQGNAVLCDTLRQYLPALMVWFDWLRCHVALWLVSSISTHRNLWEAIAGFLNVFSSVQLPDCPTSEKGGEQVSLIEDEFLAGFKPLNDVKRPTLTISNKNQKDIAEDYLRVTVIRDFASFLLSLDNPPVQQNEETGLYCACIASLPSSPEVESTSTHVVQVDVHQPSHHLEPDSDDVIIESIEDAYYSGDEENKGFQQLKAKKDALAREVEAHQERHDKAKALVHENISRPHLMLENYPTYLVPDTNCFVDHLDGLSAIVHSGEFVLVVPLVVINELDGLGREPMLDKYHDPRHAQRVYLNARAAIDFLEDQFSLRNPQVNALTSKGSVLDTIAYRSEDPSARKGNNDDVILSCCLHYCEENFVHRLATADQPITIRRKVVLLTDDRNLRLKAYTRNVPVLPVPLFRRMAHV